MSDTGSEQTTVLPWARDLNTDAEQVFVEERGNVGEITVGTVVEYDGWQWAAVTEIATDRDEPMIGLVLLDELPDAVVQRLEHADGCRQHYRCVEEFRDGEHEYWAPVEYVRDDDIWEVRGPVHPDHRSNGGDADE